MSEHIMRMMKKAVVLALCSSAVLVAGCAGTTQKQKTAEFRDPYEQEAQVWDAWADDGNSNWSFMNKVKGRYPYRR
ncbi:hypothetical protein [Desulfovibrio cuneatus]|uniref:hypothetical protein n=1 Tax=Desulfovibrio cuneatus TaxID=159728 RepID=UPI00048054FE|nr:hypothetical protein [Desulfovibrio cuneatus]